jgi:hypothetical protein
MELSTLQQSIFKDIVTACLAVNSAKFDYQRF